MKNLGIFQRLILILITLSIAFGAISVGQIWSIRATILREREDKLRDMVTSVIRMVKSYDDEVKAGKCDPALFRVFVEGEVYKKVL